MEKTAFAPYGNFFINYTRASYQNDMKVQHYHDTYEIYLQISGTRKLFLNDLSYQLGEGDLYLLNPFEIHYTESLTTDPYERFVMNFPGDKLSCILTQQEKQMLFTKMDSRVIHLDNAQAAAALGHFKKADAFSGKTGFLAEKLLYSEIFQFLMELDALPAAEEEILSQSIQSEVAKAIHYVNRYYAETIDLNTLADMIHMSKYHFCRQFHAATGATFLEYLYNIRLAKVHQMLLETSLPLHDIARRTGFSSTAHLSRIFRQRYGQSPRDFRSFCSYQVKKK